MVIRTYDELTPPLPIAWPDPGRATDPPWWAGLGATHNRAVLTCPGTEHRVSLVESPDGHLVYRLHLFATYGGHLWCPRSLQPVCEQPAPKRPDLACRHQLEETA